MILVVSSPGDVHAAAVLGHLAALNAPAILLDTSDFPTRSRIELRYGGGADLRLTLGDGRPLALGECRAIWWRRPQLARIDQALFRDSHRSFALNECHEALAGMWNALDAFWVNPPPRDEVAARKAFQLRIAEDVGLTIPRTLITNDPGQARRFIDAVAPARVICKAFSATRQEWRETRILGEAELAALDNVKYAPVIFQEYIPAGVDLRITVIGDRIFPAAIHSQETSYPADFRIDIARAKIEATSLPGEVEGGLRRLMAQLGLVYGAIDMRVTPEGHHVFLEINPAGQFLFIEERTQQPIARALAEILAAHDHA